MEGELQKQEFKPIDIREVVKGKSPRNANRIPGFVYNWLSRILHLKEINAFMEQCGQLRGIEFLDQLFRELNIHYTIFGEENIPEAGRYMFVGNHPLGGLDGTIILKYLNEHVGPSMTLVNDFLMEIYPINDWFIPVNKVGGQARDSVKTVEEMYHSEKNIHIFPAGLCSRKISGKIVDLPWQKHFIQKAVQYKLDIIPIFFEGRNSNFFYNLALFRKFLRIKMNIEMMYLADELFKHRNHTFRIYFGKPIPYETFNHTKKPIEWANEIKELTYALADQF